MNYNNPIVPVKGLALAAAVSRDIMGGRYFKPFAYVIHIEISYTL